MHNSEVDELRQKLARLLDLGTRSVKLKANDVWLILKDGFTITYANLHLSQALCSIHESIERLCPGEGDALFEAEIRSWEAREPPGPSDEDKFDIRFLSPFAIVRQEAVGHGGFHTGALGFVRPLFRWVYDCGSWRKRTVLERRIHEFFERSRSDYNRPDIDILFISHFDADHVNGLERLFAGEDEIATTVKIVVAPYLGPLETFALISRELARNKSHPDFVRAVTDPSGYFRDKGVAILILIRPDSPPPPAPEGSRPPVRPLPPIPSSDKDTRLELEFFGTDGKAYALDPPDVGEIKVIEADPGSFFEMTSCGRSLNWVFVPHAHQWNFNREKIAEQVRRVLNLDPSGPSFKATLVERLRTQVGVRQIKKIYSGMNSNGTSMSLYAGPRSKGNDRIVFALPTRPAGWLLTGDAPLNKPEVFSNWKYSFAPVATMVGRLMLPHHGAVRNFNADLTRFAPKAHPFLTVDRDDFEHNKRPPRKVKEKLGKEFAAVTERKEISEISGQPDGEDMLGAVSQW
jgi:hypothetical protein